MSSFPLTATFLQYTLTAEPGGMLSLANNDNKKHQQKPKGQTQLSYLP